METSTTTRWTRNPEVVWETLGADALIVEPGTRRMWLLNASAAYIWQHCQSMSLTALVRRMGRAHGVALDVLERDAAAFIERLAAAGLIEARPSLQPVPAAVRLGRFSGMYSAPSLTPRSLGHGPRSRPGPRGNSSPG